jgi:hypothetical protein
VCGVEVAPQVVHEHESSARGRLAAPRLAGEEGLGLGEQFEQLLRSLGHGQTSCGRSGGRYGRD